MYEHPPLGEVLRALKSKVVGQERAITLLSRLIDMHFAWFDAPNSMQRAPNALIIGPTGTGKTHALRVIADSLQIPLVIVDSTRLVGSGMAGQLTLEHIVEQLVQRARIIIQNNEGMGGPESLAERGIIFLDEFDKLHSVAQDYNDITGVVQRGLLQFIEGTKVYIERDEKSVPRVIDTTGILFIASGAFSGIQSAQVKAGRTPGQSRTPDASYTIHPSDVREYGFMVELVARLPIIIKFESLGKKELREILDNKEVSPLNFYLRYFEQAGIDLKVPAETKDLIAEDAKRADVGARGLDQELFPVLCELSVREIQQRGTGISARHPLVEVTLAPGEYRQLRSKALRFK
jgi:ATP-dependent Clp protease ATP-binding subunit ClpX